MTTHAEIEELADTIDRRMAGHVGVAFARPKVSFVRLAPTTRRIRVEGRTGIAVVVQGSKRLHMDGRSYHSSGYEYLVTTSAIPGEAEVCESGASRPLLAMAVDFDWTRLGRLLLDMSDPRESAPAPRAPCISGAVDRSLARSLLHVAQLACSDQDWDVLGESALRELYYWAIRGDAGRLLRHRVARGANLDGLGRAVRFVETHLTERLEVSTIAKAAAMSPSAMYARFGEVLGQSPMQFVKRLRLESASRLIAGGESVTAAALEVGYASPSQFSRDFRRHFGRAPSSQKRRVG